MVLFATRSDLLDERDRDERRERDRVAVLIEHAQQFDVRALVDAPVVDRRRRVRILCCEIDKVANEARRASIAIDEWVNTDEFGMYGDAELTGIPVVGIRPPVGEVVQCGAQVDLDVGRIDADAEHLNSRPTRPRPDRAVQALMNVKHGCRCQESVDAELASQHCVNEIQGDSLLDLLLEFEDRGLQRWIADHRSSLRCEGVSFVRVDRRLAVPGIERHLLERVARALAASTKRRASTDGTYPLGTTRFSSLADATVERTTVRRSATGETFRTVAMSHLQEPGPFSLVYEGMPPFDPVRAIGAAPAHSPVVPTENAIGMETQGRFNRRGTSDAADASCASGSATASVWYRSF